MVRGDAAGRGDRRPGRRVRRQLRAVGRRRGDRPRRRAGLRRPRHRVVDARPRVEALRPQRERAAAPAPQGPCRPTPADGCRSCPTSTTRSCAGCCVTYAGEIRHAPTAALLDRPEGQRERAGMALLTIFVLAVFVGFEVVSKVSTTLHTPLMSGANAIHGVILVGAIIVAGTADSTPRARARAGRRRARDAEHGRRVRRDRPDARDVPAAAASRRPTTTRSTP